MLAALTSCIAQKNSNSPISDNSTAARPVLHFTPEKNWINDPNGMFFYQGEYHLFYQYNPYGEKWGHMSWGHAVSKDLITWEHLPIALEEEDKVMIFSGSAVVDHQNTSGFGTGNVPPIVAIYTAYDAKSGFQSQSIAYSNDKGRTFTKYDQNPVIDLKKADFRDPKVFWYQADQKWIMTVSLSQEKKVQFYSSKDLKKWDLMSEFGPAGVTAGIWECPDLFQLDYNNESVWVLGVNLGTHSIAGGSGLQYFLGDFDGKSFKVNKSLTKEPLNFIEYGKDFYAAVVWNGTPKETKERKWLGWMNNWEYADKVPYYGWRGSMSVPRTLSLEKKDGFFYLKQEPVKEIDNYKKKSIVKSEATIEQANKLLSSFTKSDSLSFSTVFTVNPSTIHDFLRFNIKSKGSSIINFSYNKNTNELILERRKSDKYVNSKQFPTIQKIKLDHSDKEFQVRIIVDKYSMEVFTHDGKYVFTNLFFAPNSVLNVSFETSKQDQKLVFKSVGLDTYL
ncbi:glycoside hydrolase family 32 protein [Flavobacterium sp. HBTb2-11-1]|uniref:glycoside hydrolase family 32 protein n=1 Tax=Flavobacterium sp. HBTb2-11-1 TaxID=2692212 RepID=UPI00137142AC|nr:glycoside hydrolase family 32 protein [Flavobacterium sp. HBTb2-11-1]